MRRTWWQSQNYSHYPHYHFLSSLLDMWQSNNIISHVIRLHCSTPIYHWKWTTADQISIHILGVKLDSVAHFQAQMVLFTLHLFVTDFLVFWLVYYFST